MTATDELRRMLDERGVEYTTKDDMGATETSWNGYTAYQLTPGSKLIMHHTPEQAIAATLGSDDKSRYSELFGTPERAARTLLDACDNCGQDECSGCQVYELTSGGDLDYDALLEWLKQEVDA